MTSIDIDMHLDNFQPESVDKSRPGGLVGNGETFELEFSGNGGSSSHMDQNHHHSVLNGGGNAGGGETFSWSSTERQGRLVDCLLIFDEATQVMLWLLTACEVEDMSRSFLCSFMKEGTFSVLSAIIVVEECYIVARLIDDDGDSRH